MVRSRSAPAPPAPQRYAVIAKGRSLGEKNIVLVEDDEHLQSILTRSLRKRGHEVRSARLGSEARLLLARQTPSVLILDINLPDETGWDVLRWLSEQPGKRPQVIVLTAFRPPRRAIGDLAPYRLLTKPFPIEALTRLVEGDSDEPAIGIEGDIAS
jgi:DNA-binding response OmpR family regulator